MANNKLTDERIVSLIFLAREWVGVTAADYFDIAAALVELQGYRQSPEPIGAPDAWLWKKKTGYITAGINRPMYEPLYSAAIPLYAIPPQPAPAVEAAVVPEWTNEQCLEFLSIAFRHAEIKGDLEMDDIRLGVKMVNACRAAMLQDGNSPVTPDCWIPVSERMPERDVDVQVYCADKKEQMVGYMERNETEGWFRFASLPNGGGVYCKPTHWMSLPAAPQQAKSQHKKK
ncbi:TPA: DUF551 domain-containing protein [Citrobacter freundii]